MNLMLHSQSTFLRSFMMAMAFFALPLTFIGFELVALRNSLAHEEDNQRVGELLNSLQTLKTRKALLGDCQKWFDEALRRSATASSPRSFLEEVRKRGPRELNLSMTFLVLQPDGKVDEALSDFRPPDSLIPFIANDLADLERGQPEGLRSRLAAYQDCFGALMYNFKGNPVGIHRVGIFEKHRYLYVSPSSTAGRLLVRIDQPPDWNIRELQWDLSRHLAQYPEERGAVLLQGSQPDELQPVLGSGFNSGWRASLLLGPSTRKGIRVEDWLWVQVPIDRSIRLLLGRPDASYQQLLSFRRNIVFLLLAIFVGSTTVFLWWMNSPRRMPLRLPVRLFLLLAYVVGLPLLVYGLTARTLARDLTEVRERKWEARQSGILEELDQRLSDYVGLVESTLLQKMYPGGDPGNAKPQLIRNLQKFNQDFHPMTILLLDRNGETCFDTGANSADLPAPLKVMLQRACVKALNVPSGSGKGDELAATLAESEGFNPKLLESIFLERPNRLTDFGLEGSNLAFILNLVGGTDGHPDFVILTAWFHLNLDEKFIKRRLPIFQAGNPNIILATQYHWGPKTEPATSPFSECAEKVWQEFREAHRSRTLSLSLKSGNWLLTGKRGNKLRWLLIMAGSKADVRDAPRVLFHKRVGLIGSLLALAGLIIARLLAAAFLVPIRELTLGVDALARRDFSHRIPPIDGAEFGQLGVAFNKMQEDLKDLELAKILQERIYPSGTTSLGHGWEIYGNCRPMTEVGGDFYDFIPLDDGRWFIVIGDVSGHGTPAALIVAMAKGLFAHAPKQPDPMQALRNVHSVLGRVLPRKQMMMTCFAILFDPSTGLIQFSNAGHNYPYLVDGLGATQELKLLGMPLGLGRKRTDAKGEVFLNPDDFLFLYTDGLIEASDPQDNPIGYQAVQDSLSTLGHFGAREGVEALWQWFDSRAGSGPQTDDITLLLLTHRPGPGSACNLQPDQTSSCHNNEVVV
jgi:HAMP domain-containing protein